MLKGFLTILVVIGHIIVKFSDNPFDSLIFKYCYSFHMFLYIYVSGYLIAEKNHDFQWIIKRFFRIIIPYTIWTIIFYLIYTHPYSFTGFLHDLFLEPYFWFLPVLFLCDFLLFLSERIKNIYLSFIFFIFLLNILYVIHIFDGNETLKMLTIYFPFYCAAIFIRKKDIHVNKILTIALAVLYIISMFFYSYKDHSSQINFINTYLNINKTGLLNTFFVFYNHYFVAPLGCFVFWNLFKYLRNITFIDKVFSYFGKYTLQIYILENFFFINIFSNYYLNSFIVFALIIFCSIFFSVIISKSKKLNQLLFGL